MKIVKVGFSTNPYYATKKRILTYKEHAYTPEEAKRQDYYYVKDVKQITEEEYDKANQAYREYIEEHKNDKDKVPDEIEFYALQARREVLRGWTAQRNDGERYELNQAFPLIDTLNSLLDKESMRNYQRVQKGNYLADEIEWEKRKEKWRQQKKERLLFELEKEEFEQMKKQYLPEYIDVKEWEDYLEKRLMEDDTVE